MQDEWPLHMKAWSLMVVKRDRQLMTKKFCCGALLEDVATLFGIAQSKGLHGQCVLEVFWNTSVSKRQAIVVTRYLGAYEGAFDPQTGPSQCGAGCAKLTRRVPSNGNHPNLVANVYWWRKFVMQDTRGVHQLPRSTKASRWASQEQGAQGS